MSRLQDNYRERRAALERFVRRLLSGPDDAADVAHEAFLRMYAAEVGGQTPASEALLYAGAKNLALDKVRGRTSRAIDDSADAEDLEFVDGRPDPSSILQQRRMVQAVEAAMARMPGRCLDAFRLRKIDGLPQAEIVARMGISAKTVEKHITLALQLCHRALVESPTTHSERQPRDIS